MSVTIAAVVANKIGFASHQNAVPVLRELELRSASDQLLQDVTLTLTADPPFLAPKTWRIDRLAANSTLHINDRDIALNAALLGDLAESLRGKVTLRLEGEGTCLAEISHPVELLARAEWGGLGAMAELLPAFVMPNDPAVDRILRAASDVLRRAGRPDAIDGYVSKSRERVWELTSAIWSAVVGLRISYALPPASFEQQGQKVRTPGAILENRIATCLDTSLLFAAALEQAGLNPLLVLTEGHAFVGVWLQPVEFASLITDEAAALRRRIDLQELVAFESTLATHASPPAFSNAVKVAQRLLAEDAPNPFAAAVDIRRARMQKIRPLSAIGTRPELATDLDAPSVSEGLEAPPVLPGFDVEVTEENGATADRIALWQRKLLNLTTSNRLLNVPEGGKIVRLVCPEPCLLEDRLASGGKVRIVTMPDLGIGGRDERLYEAQTSESLREDHARLALGRGEVLSPLEKDKLEAVLIDLYRKAKSDLEEGGANTLFLVLGFLKWKKSASDPRTYRAPLVLLPVRLERRSALSGVSMVQHEDEPRFNLTLLELLRQDFELTIPPLEGPLPTDSSGIDLPAVLTMVRRAVRDIAGFEVTEEVALGTFSFAKYLMWKDLVDRAESLKECRVVRHLIERGEAVADRDQGFPRVEELDALADPGTLFTPLPADSSQLAAVVASAKGHDFVLDGPPGTGKSQTIANIIAHNLALGRRVLFVAEKRAALEVVQRRLAQKGLGEFCLELHSAKATKLEVLKQLDRAWNVRDTMSEDDWSREAAEVRRLRDELNEVVAALHHREPNGLTVHQAIGRVVRDWTPAMPRLAFTPGTRHSEAQMATFRDVARRLGLARAEVTGVPDAFETVATTEWSNGWQEALIEASQALPGRIDALARAAEAIAAATRIPMAGTERDELVQISRLVAVLLSSHGLDLRFAFAPNLADVASATRRALDLIEAYRREEAALSAPYAPEAVRRIALDALQSDWAAAVARIWPLSFFSRRRVSRALAEQGGASGVVDVEADLPRLKTMRELLTEIDTLAPRAATVPGWAGLASAIEPIIALLALADDLRRSLAAAAEDPERLVAVRQAAATLVLDANDLLAPDARIARAHHALQEALAQFDTAFERFQTLAANTASAKDITALRACAVTLVSEQARLKAWTDWRRVRDEAVAHGLGSLAAAVDRGTIAATDVPSAFETAYAHWYASTRIDSEPLLSRFASRMHMDKIETFRRLDARLSELAVRYIRARLCGVIPPKEGVSRKDGYAVLRHQLQLQKRHKPIRQLATEMGEAFTRLAPCMLMSPLSIAQYLPPGQALFDLVIFDEASQIAPWDAIGAMARGTQVIVAGDPRQMPPTSFFTRGAAASDSESDTEEDMESILDECLAAGLRMHSLSWHYRSRHESLIAFSNHRYYDSSLVTFPAPVTRESAVEWRRVPGVYARGKDRTNTIEAKAIVNEAVRRLLDPTFIAEGRTLGIITLNADQQRLVENLLDQVRRERPELEPWFSEERAEPVVVKNLETVQGDERDVMLLGIGFGPTEPGSPTMSMSFGALNSQGGWRRLNVAITRARQEMVIFTSFDPSMIDLNRTSARAVRDLKHFVEFADRGPRALAEAVQGSVGGFESPFEQAVAQELARRGWSVVPQIGVSRFRIDLGIVHPDRPGDFLVGVECDGATYHSAATARDRDRVRAAILEGLGWRLIRVWSTDWWVDRAGAADRLHRAIEAALASSREVTGPRSRTFDEMREDEAEAEATKLTEAVHMFASEVVPSAMPQRIATGRPDLLAPSPTYRQADLSAFREQIDADAFYEAHYDETLAAMVAFVLEQEAPIAEGALVHRIARAHGFLRSGRIIKDRVMSIARARHHTAPDGNAALLVWPHARAAENWIGYRTPATDDDIRQIEDISLVELREAARESSAEDVPVDVARRFGVRRLSVAARQRIEAAMELSVA